MKRVGVGELRRQPSQLLARVAAGESFEVTAAGAPARCWSRWPRNEGLTRSWLLDGPGQANGICASWAAATAAAWSAATE